MRDIRNRVECNNNGKGEGGKLKGKGREDVYLNVHYRHTKSPDIPPTLLYRLNARIETVGPFY